MATKKTKAVEPKKNSTGSAKSPAKKKASAVKSGPRKAEKKPSPSRMGTHKPSGPKTGAKKAATKSATLSPVEAKAKIDQRIASLTDWRGPRLAQIRKLIHEVDAQVIEDWKWMGTPVWSNNGMYVLANPHKDKVKITFVHGAQLVDPKKIFNNGLDGGKWRAIDLYEGDKLDERAFKGLLREAIAYNKTHTVAKSKGSRAI